MPPCSSVAPVSLNQTLIGQSSVNYQRGHQFRKTIFLCLPGKQQFDDTALQTILPGNCADTLKGKYVGEKIFLQTIPLQISVLLDNFLMFNLNEVLEYASWVGYRAFLKDVSLVGYLRKGHFRQMQNLQIRRL